MEERTLEDVIDALCHSRDMRKRGCSLLIGAGCSVTGGIATAPGFVRLIGDRFKAAHGRAEARMSSGPPSYPQCMAELSRGQQRDLINEQVSGARINWAHMAIAQLIREGYVDRVLTTNFDPLVLRACAMLGEFPAVYDFAISQLFRPGELPEKAVFHLHGQSTGFVLMNTETEVEEHSQRLGPLFHDAGQARPWIIVGYSGDNDPVFDHLAKVDRFDYGLFWVGYKDEEPKQHVREKLLLAEKDAYIVRGFDADRFFVELARKLECFPPDFVQRPFSFLKGSLSTLTEYRPLVGDTEIDILRELRELIDRAIAQFEEPEPGDTRQRSSEAIELAATSLLMAGKHEDLAELAEMLGDEMSTGFRELIAWSHIQQGDALSDQALTKSGEAADALFQAAGEKYAQALATKPDMHEALNNWGTALSDQAQTKSGKAADTLFQTAGEKYAQALTIKPDMHEALNNWGTALSDQAKTKSGEAADALFQAAYQKYAEALAIKPDMHEALNGWGTALSDQAQTKIGEVADALFRAACEKFAEALAVKSDNHEALNNWGIALSAQAQTRSGDAADALFQSAGEKYAEALAIKPGMHEALLNWGIALRKQAKTKSGDAADVLFHAAFEQYAQALAIKPDKYEALYNWGIALCCQAQTKSGDAADTLFHAAFEQYAQALAIKPDMHEALGNWGTALLFQARTKNGDAADALFQAAGERYAQALAIKPDMHEALLNWGAALGYQAQTKSGEAADALFHAAGERYAQALAIKPSMHEALHSWANALSGQAKTKSGEAADALFEAASEKYAEALSIKPDLHKALSNWGGNYLAWSLQKDPSEAAAMLLQAEEKLLAGEAVAPGSASYNLACVAARRGDAPACENWLRRARDFGVLPDQEHLLADPDLASIRDQEWFQAFLAEGE
jgi:Plant specific mitochondrial import receptor subunit TOM20.